jgi:hypothetical protein
MHHLPVRPEHLATVQVCLPSAPHVIVDPLLPVQRFAGVVLLDPVLPQALGADDVGGELIKYLSKDIARVWADPS